jgi:hypothetical protein
VVPDARSMIKCLLWTVTQNGVYDANAAGMLGPIKTSLERNSPMLDVQSPARLPDDLSEELDIEDHYCDIYSEEEYMYSPSREDLFLDSERDHDFISIAHALDNLESNHCHRGREDQELQETIEIEQIYEESDEIISFGSLQDAHVMSFLPDCDINNEAFQEESLLSPSFASSQSQNSMGGLGSVATTTSNECHTPPLMEEALDFNMMVSRGFLEQALLEETDVAIWGLRNISAKATIFTNGDHDDNHDEEMLHG